MSGVGEHGRFVTKAISKIQQIYSRNSELEQELPSHSREQESLRAAIILCPNSKPVLQGALHGQK